MCKKFEFYYNNIKSKFNEELLLTDYNAIMNYVEKNQNIKIDNYLNIDCINCTNCFACINCEDCVKCFRCICCFDSSDCTDCINCKHCHNCVNDSGQNNKDNLIEALNNNTITGLDLHNGKLTTSAKILEHIKTNTSLIDIKFYSVIFDDINLLYNLTISNKSLKKLYFINCKFIDKLMLLSLIQILFDSSDKITINELIFTNCNHDINATLINICSDIIRASDNIAFNTASLNISDKTLTLSNV